MIRTGSDPPSPTAHDRSKQSAYAVGVESPEFRAGPGRDCTAAVADCSKIARAHEATSPRSVMEAAFSSSSPSRVLDGGLAGFDNAIARGEPNRHGCLDQFDVGPLESVAVNVVGDLGQQDPFRLQSAVRLRDKRPVAMQEIGFKRHPSAAQPPPSGWRVASGKWQVAGEENPTLRSSTRHPTLAT